ncbi:MAG: regulatory iron-sulfur-containing complex subunit RicT [Rhodothermales bacterium]
MACSSCSSGGGCGSQGGCGSGKAGSSSCPSMQAYDWLTDLGIVTAPVVYPLVEIAFKGGRKGVYRNAENLELQTGDFVIVEADRGIDFGSVHLVGEMVRLRMKSKGLDEEHEFPGIARLATLKDIERWEAIKEEEAEAFLVGRRTIDHMNLPMKLVDAEWQFDQKKITFYFTADHRVDFRELVRELARRFRTRVELRQIGARDEAARIGGIGSCGRELCCSTWLQDFKPVSTQAARVQNLPLNPVRLSGQCGRLKCCLNYELEQYMSALRSFPAVDTPITTHQGEGIIQKLDIFHDRVWIEHADGTWEDLSLDEVTAILGEQPPRPTPASPRRAVPARLPRRPQGGG